MLPGASSCERTSCEMGLAVGFGCRPVVLGGVGLVGDDNPLFRTVRRLYEIAAPCSVQLRALHETASIAGLRSNEGGAVACA